MAETLVHADESTFGNTTWPLDGRVLRLLAEMGSRLAQHGEAEELQKVILTEAARALDCDSGTLALWDSGGKVLKPGPVVGNGRALQEMDFLGNRVAKALLVGNHRAATFNSPAAELGPGVRGFSAVVAAPLMAGARPVALVVLGTQETGRKFSAADAALLEVAANFSASVLESSVEFAAFTRDLRAKIIDATRELSRAQAELSRVKSFNERLFESIAMGIVVFDRSFSVVFRNRMAEQCFPEDRNVLQALARTGVGQRYPGYEEMFRDVVRLGQVCGFDGVPYGRNEEMKLVLRLSCAPLSGGRAGAAGGILTVEDVTQNVSMQQRLQASERLAAVGKLASKVAHELNNPLDGILRYIRMAYRLCEGASDARAAGYLKEAQGGLMRMVRIIGELLEYSRSTTHVAADGDIRTAIQDAVKSLAGLAERKKVRLRTEIAADVPPLESASLYQVFTNLVKNALEAAPEGGEVRIEALAAAGAVEVRVADNGAGIPEAHMAQIFEPFFSTKEPGQGTGLGLAICKELVEKHGGSLAARNRPEGGAEFVVRIPTRWVRGAGSAADEGSAL